MSLASIRQLSLLSLFLAFLAGARVASAPQAGGAGGLAAVFKDALALAERHEGARVLRVSGQSMVPFFGDGAVLVMKPLAAIDLRPGMVAVYENRFGEIIAHRVLSLIEGGWRVRGFNNTRADSTVVDQSNLRGVVYAIFHPRRGRSGTTDELTLDLIRSTVTVLAAPAR